MAQFEYWMTTDLKRGSSQVQVLHGQTFTQDNLGNRVGVVVLDGGEPATMNGTVTGYVIRADGGTVLVVGATDGNRAYIDLPESAYAVPGQIQIAIRLTSGETKTVLGALNAYVQRTATGTIIDPGHVVPDIDDIIAKMDEVDEAIDNAEAATAAASAAAVAAGYCNITSSKSGNVITVTTTDNTDTSTSHTVTDPSGMIAPSEATSTAAAAHAAGTYLIYNGVLYQATKDIAAGDTLATTGADANIAAVPGGVTGEVADLKSAFDDFNSDIVYTKQTATWTQGRLQKEAGTNNLVAGSSTKYAYSSFVTATGDEQIRIADGYSCVVWECNYNELGHPVRDVSTGYSTENIDYEYDSTWKYLVACVKRTDNADITTQESNQAVVFYKKEQTIFATKQALSDQNTSLTNAYTAADAVIEAEVDDVSETLENALEDKAWNELDITWNLGQVTKSNNISVLVESTKFAYSGFIPVSDDATITIADGYLGFAWYSAYNEFGHPLGNISSGYNSGEVTYDYNPTYPYVIVCVKRSDSGVITTTEAASAVTVSELRKTIFATKERVEQIADSFDDFTKDIIYEKQTVNLTQGRLLKSSGNLTYSASTKYAYSDFVEATGDEQIRIADGYNGFVWSCHYNELGHPVHDVSSSYSSGTVNYTYDSTYKYIIACVRKDDNSNITTQEANQAVVFCKKDKTIFATKERVEQIAESSGSSASVTPTKGQVCYLGDTKSNSGYICNAISYDDGVIIAARSNGTVVRIGYSGTEETLLSLTGSLFDWRCLWMDSNENVYASPHASLGEMNVSDRGLYRMAKGGSSFTKVLSLYDTSSQVTTETQNNDDTIWTMCEDADGNLYAGVYAHTIRANPAIYKSTDGGLTWTYVFNFNTAGLTTNGKHIHTIIFSKWQNALYCIVGEVNTVFKSTDGGTTWTDLHVTLTVKGSSMLATEYGIFIGSDGAYNCDIDILYPDDTTHKKVYQGWANTVFAIRQSDVTGILYAFTKIDSSVNSLAYYPPVAALTDPDEITAWLASEDATHKADWQAYYDSVIDIYPDDAIRPQHYSIIASRDGGMTWSPVKAFSCASTAANGCWTTGFFINGECLTGRMENGTSIKPVIISEGKHKYVSGGCDLSGEIFVRTNTNATNELI